MVLYTVITAVSVVFLVPPAEGLGNLVRLAFFHIPAAWVAVLAFLWSAFYAARQLHGSRAADDAVSARAAALGLFFCFLGTVSGAFFARLTWGAYWNWDPRQITIFVLLLLYGAYFALRSSVPDTRLRAKVSAVYSLLACGVMPFLVFVIPRFYFSLHPEPLLNRSGTIHMDTLMLVILFMALADGTWIFLRFLYGKGESE